MTNLLVPSTDVVYVLVEDRESFDKIARPATDHGAKPGGHCLSKTVEQDGVLVIFQHWLQ